MDRKRFVLLGLTGSVGMGKSVAADCLRGFGLPVADTDQIARDLVEPGQPALAEIRSHFGGGVIGSDGHLRRDVLARIVFGDQARRKELEAILHPRIRTAWLEQVRAWRDVPSPALRAPSPVRREREGVRAGSWEAAAPEAASEDPGRRGLAAHSAGVVVIPLLFETGAESEFTATICVACSAASQLDRLGARGWSREEAERRIQAQWPIERKLAAADFVVWAEGGVDLTRQQLERVLRHVAPTWNRGAN